MGAAARFDVLRPQRLAAPATIYVEQFSAHPLEHDAAELYAPPDGYVDAEGRFHEARQDDSDVPVYRVEIRPEDGFYPLPYMARQADGGAWEDDCAFDGAPEEQARQSFYPDGSRSFEEIDRLGIGHEGVGNLISSKADVDFYRVLPSSGYKKGLAAADRTDVGEGDIAPEVMGRDFFAYRPIHLRASPPRPSLAHIVNTVQRILDSGDYLGAIWTQGSPRIEETMYWFGLLLDTTLPVCGNAAQRTHGQISCDGPRKHRRFGSTTSPRASGPTRPGATAPAWCSSRSSRYFACAMSRKATPGRAATSPPVVTAASSVASVTNRRRR